MKPADFKSDIYNALADVMFRYSKGGIDITKSECNVALDWFKAKFFEDEDGVAN